MWVHNDPPRCLMMREVITCILTLCVPDPFTMTFRLHSQSHEQRCNNGEDVCLKKCDKQFQKVDTDNERGRDRCNPDVFEQKDETDERDNDRVPSRHIRKETDAECELFGEKT